MPHVRIEYSSDLAPPPHAALFEDLNGVVASISGAPATNVKSRMSSADVFVGDGSPEHAMVHCDIALMEGRSSETKKRLAESCRDLLLDAFGPDAADRELQVTVEVRDIERTTYAKHPPGTIAPAFGADDP